MNINLDIEVAIRLLISFAIGTAIGIEREYRSKSAGLRTMIMICLGSTIFTEISIHIGGGSQPLVYQAFYDEGFGTLTACSDFNTNVTAYGYDAFARLIHSEAQKFSVIIKAAGLQGTQ